MPANSSALQSDISIALVSDYAENFQRRFGDHAFEKAMAHLTIAIFECDAETAHVWLQVC